MPSEAMIIPCDLPTPDMIYVNHPEHGLVFFIDRRVDREDVGTMLMFIHRRLTLHPEWIPTPAFHIA